MTAPRPTSVAIAAPLAALAPAAAIIAMQASIGASPTSPEAIGAGLLVWIMASLNTLLVGGFIAALIRPTPRSLGRQAAGAAGFVVATLLLLVLLGASVLESLGFAAPSCLITIGLAVLVERRRGPGRYW